MMNSLAQWHARYMQQAAWTRELRRHILGQIAWTPGARILEVGCGTGAVLSDLRDSASSFGIDVDLASLRFAKTSLPRRHPLVQADAHTLPFSNGCFKVVYCHFLLLWVSQPERVIAEMARVAERGGAVVAFAEPDYSNRSDEPPPLEVLGGLQNMSLRNQGAHTTIGIRLESIFSRSSLVNVHTGILEPAFQMPITGQEKDLEWQVLMHDLSKLPDFTESSPLMRSARDAWHSAQHRTFIPIHYAIGYLP